MLAPDDSVLPLNTEERTRLGQLDDLIETTLQKFLICGRALSEIRSRRLYREEFPTFETYCVARWGISAHRALEIVRSTQTAEHLLAGAGGPNGDSPLPPDLAEDVMRPLSKLRPELQTECWRLACKVTEKPTHFVVAKIVRVVTSAITEGCGNGERKPKRTESEASVFMRPIYVLSRAQFPGAELLVYPIEDLAQAKRCQVACQELIARCEVIVAELNRKFPGLGSS
jgi:hypothetical protein